MDQILNYVKPELLIVAVVLYFIGAGLKKAQTFKDKYIPLILGVIGIVLCAIWVLGTCPTDVGRILRTFKIKKNVEVTDNGKIII